MPISGPTWGPTHCVIRASPFPHSNQKVTRWFKYLAATGYLVNFLPFDTNSELASFCHQIQHFSVLHSHSDATTSDHNDGNSPCSYLLHLQASLPPLVPLPPPFRSLQSLPAVNSNIGIYTSDCLHASLHLECIRQIISSWPFAQSFCIVRQYQTPSLEATPTAPWGVCAFLARGELWVGLTDSWSQARLQPTALHGIGLGRGATSLPAVRRGATFSPSAYCPLGLLLIPLPGFSSQLFG